MRKLLAIFAIFFLSVLPSFGYELDRAMLEGMVIKSVKADVQKQLAQYKPDVIEVKITNLPLNVPIKTQNPPKIEIVSHYDRFMQYDIKRVVIKENDKTIKVLPISTKTNVYKDVLVARDFISQFGVINSKNTYKKRMEVAGTIKDVMGEIKTDLVATRNVSKEGLILNCYTKSKPDVVRNSFVKIMFKKGEDFNIETDGVALREGRIGDVIVVKNAKYNKMYSATVTEPNKVEVRL